MSSLQAKGAFPIVSSQTPDNIWNTDGSLSASSRFVSYAQESATATEADYVDHNSYVAQAYENLGETTVDTYYPIDHTHTSATGANVVAEAFVRGLLCGNSSLVVLVNDAGQAVPSTYH